MLNRCYLGFAGSAMVNYWEKSIIIACNLSGVTGRYGLMKREKTARHHTGRPFDLSERRKDQRAAARSR